MVFATHERNLATDIPVAPPASLHFPINGPIILQALAPTSYLFFTFHITEYKNGPSFSVVRLSHDMTKITMCSCEDLEKPFSRRVAK